MLNAFNRSSTFARYMTTGGRTPKTHEVFRAKFQNRSAKGFGAKRARQEMFYSVVEISVFVVAVTTKINKNALNSRLVLKALEARRH